MMQETDLRQGIRKWRQLRSDPRVRLGCKALGYAAAGFALSAVSLGKQPQPVAMGLVCALRGWRAAAAALGSMLGYRTIWAEAGDQGAVWSLGGCVAAMIFGRRQERSPWLLPAAGMLTVALAGLIFRLWLGDTAPVGLYWLRVLTGGLSTGVFQKLWETLSEEGTLPLRKGVLATAQVRLEIMAGVLSQTQQQLLETPPDGVDEDALMERTRERACGGCPNRKGCTAVTQLMPELLHSPLTDTASLGIGCKKPNRLLLELRRSREQLRMLCAGISRRREYRDAVIQQYRFLAGYLRQTADELGTGPERLRLRFKPEVQIATSGKEISNGDRCQAFAGAGGKYYVLLCDGMGTGLGAAQEGQEALRLLRQMLAAGFPAEYALQSIHSLCCLRGRAGAVTLDLAELHLETGKAAVYKWGAAPSVLLRGSGGEKIGTAGPPPGMDISKTRETVDRLSLRRGETLILMSDGVELEAVLRCGWIASGEPLGEYAAKLLAVCSEEKGDDATVAAIRLHPTSLYT